ncbi:hypothetical protein P1X14_10535 [Sphingomonas sp. AOB5]|uniref:hypothetical protein n=1 Tax=Sphingomonas sp. AOB5 TaxID=3034017 RepID=UPI0023F9E783|nr:hypothetical protein [Sphingomonas sp. AOB5]MDF7775683.1 hypothetical protein [Sphingomonas sp. AOB5]
MRFALTASCLLMAGTATAQPSPVGRTFHYERTNRDGSEPEQIYMHRAAEDRVVVYKMVERCTRSALVTATIDPETGEATKLVAARLEPGAKSQAYAEMVFDPAKKRIDATIAGNPPTKLALDVPMRPWHLYDYDLGTLAAAMQAQPGSRKSFGFGMALVWPGSPSPLIWTGEATARFVGIERHLDRNTLRFDVSGPAFGDKGGGPLWVDARSGYIVDVQWGRPNHDNYRDFRLKLIGEEPAGDAAWTALLTRHFEGCPGGTSAP